MTSHIHIRPNPLQPSKVTYTVRALALSQYRPSTFPLPSLSLAPWPSPHPQLCTSLARPAAIDAAHLTPALTITAATLAIGAAALGRLALDTAAALARTSRPHRGNE